MPFRSQNQFHLFAAKLDRGEISKAEFDKWVDESPAFNRLPKRLSDKKKKAHKEGSAYEEKHESSKEAKSEGDY